MADGVSGTSGQKPFPKPAFLEGPRDSRIDPTSLTFPCESMASTSFRVRLWMEPGMALFLHHSRVASARDFPRSLHSRFHAEM